MDLRWLKPLLGRPAPFVTVHLDATRADVAGDVDAAERWRSLRRGLERDGAPAAVLDAITELVSVPPSRRDPHGRLIVADAHGVIVDRVLADPPAASTAEVGPVPVLLPAARAADEEVRYLLVEVDRTGADLVDVCTAEPGPDESSRESVEGGHDDVHKTREGGLSRRSQTRAEDSWERNAEAVAAAVDRRVRATKPELVTLTGDVRSVALVRESLGAEAAALVVEVPGGGRGEGVHREAFAAHVAQELTRLRTRRRRAVLDRYRQGHGRGDGAVSGLDGVVAALCRGQVAELLVQEDLLDGRVREQTLRVGPEPLHLGRGDGDLDAMGVAGERRSMSAGAALVRAALGQDAGVTIADGLELADGVGAVLRWSDGSTRGDGLLSQSADVGRVRTLA